MTIADLVAPPDRQQAPVKTLAFVEFQLRVLGLLCAAAARKPTSLITPGSLDTWSRYIMANRGVFECVTCESIAGKIAGCVNMEIAAGASLRETRNQVFHGLTDPLEFDADAVYRIVVDNAAGIEEIHDHGHVGQLDPFFVPIDGELAALNGHSKGFATYWPRRRPATDITRPEILDSLQQLVPPGAGWDRVLEGFVLDIQKDLLGFAEKNSVQTLANPNEPIIVRWERRTSEGFERRVDTFRIGVDFARLWQAGDGSFKSYKAFLADVCKWELLKERLLEQLDEQVELESQISETLFPDLRRHIPDVPASVQAEEGRLGQGGIAPLEDVCERIAEESEFRTSYTNLLTLTGEAGSGKTHGLLKFARRSLAAGRDLKPLVFYLASNSSSAKSLESLLGGKMARTQILDGTSALALCRAGLAILVIDGFDEMLGFRTYDSPLAGLSPILNELRGRGTIILSARSSYAETRLRGNLEQHDTLSWRPHVTTLELLPWTREQRKALTSQLSIEAEDAGIEPEIRQLLTTPFFCLAFAAWVRSDRSSGFLPSVVDTYLQRERGKLIGEGGVPIFDSTTLEDIFSEVADMIARNDMEEVSSDDLELAASQALGRELTGQEQRRVESLCGMSAEWAEGEHAFKFTHLAIAEQFLARQIVRVPAAQAVSLLAQRAISKLCARLVVSMWATKHHGPPAELIAALKQIVEALEVPLDSPAATSLGELWAGVHENEDGPRVARRIKLQNLVLGGSGRVTLREARVDHLTVLPGVELQLDSCRVTLLDLSQSSGSALIGDSYKQVRELLTTTKLVVGPAQIRKELGVLEDESGGVSETDEYFKSNISADRRGIIVTQRDLSPDDDVRLKWIESFGLEVWREFVRRMQDEGKIVLDRVVTGGRPKVRLRPTGSFED